jgi:hypothetical protein
MKKIKGPQEGIASPRSCLKKTLEKSKCYFYINCKQLERSGESFLWGSIATKLKRQVIILNTIVLDE